MVVNSYPQHLAKDLIVGIIYISSFLNFFIIIFFFLLSNIIAKLRQEGALSTNVYHENNSRQHGMCLGEHYITGLKTETNKQKKKKEYTIKTKKQEVLPALQKRL